MISNEQIVSYPIQLQDVERINTDELTIIRNRRALKRFQIQQTITERIMQTIAIVSIFGVSIFGVGALSCWALETIEADTKSVIQTKQYEWQTRKYICLGWMLFALSSFVGSDLGSQKHKP